MIKAKKKHGLKDVGRLPKNQLLTKVGEKIKKDQEPMIRVHKPIRSIKGVLTTWKMTSDAEMDIQTFHEVTRGKRMDIIRNRGLKGVKINYRITNRRIQIEKNIQRVTEQHINSRMRVAHELIISVVRSRVEYFSIFEFFD